MKALDGFGDRNIDAVFLKNTYSYLIIGFSFGIFYFLIYQIAKFI
jgi:hypothetical protein